MRIGILTLHSNTNFGGTLQQIALYETLKSMGHEPKFLCVKNNTSLSLHKYLLGIATSYSLHQLYDAVDEAFKRLIKKEGNETPNYELYKKVDNFNYAQLNYTPKFPLRELSDYVSTCDTLVFGSDQIWTDVYSEILPYFGDGMPQFKGKKIAYAACSVHKRVPIYNRKKIQRLLSEFDVISVRDKTTQQLVKQYSGIDAPIVCDPTLLYDFTAYFKPSPIEGEYIFSYVLGDKPSEWHQHNIEKIKRETGVSKVVALTTSLDEKYPWADIVITDALAVDWMNILRESAFVYTNSYHAVIFSLKFHHDFVAYYGDLVRSSRMVSLREQFKLDIRIVSDLKNVDFCKQIDFDYCDSIIDSLSQISADFLCKSLSNDMLQ